MKLRMGVNLVLDRINDLLAFLAAIILVFITLAICWGVASRYFLNRAVAGLFEITEYSLVFITFLGAAWLLRAEGHVKMDILLTRLNPKTQALLNVITSVFAAIPCLFLTWFGARLALHYFQEGIRLPTELEPPAYLLYAIIPIGSLLLFIQFLRRSYGYLMTWRESRIKNEVRSASFEL